MPDIIMLLIFWAITILFFWIATLIERKRNEPLNINKGTFDRFLLDRYYIWPLTDKLKKRKLYNIKGILLIIAYLPVSLLVLWYITS